jgi:DNA invertase Pin-like site-specific DNA recombinase
MLHGHVGYARVSTIDQDLSIQKAAHKAAGCDPIRSEKRSGTSIIGRDELRTVLNFLREGDTLTVTRIDRLARGIGEVCGGVVERALQEVIAARLAKFGPHPSHLPGWKPPWMQQRDAAKAAALRK